MRWMAQEKQSKTCTAPCACTSKLIRSRFRIPRIVPCATGCGPRRRRASGRRASRPAITRTCGVSRARPAPGATSRSSWPNAASSTTGVPNCRALTAFDGGGVRVVGDQQAGQPGHDWSRRAAPPRSARSSSSSRSTEVSPEKATRMPCTSGSPGSYRPGLGYGHAGRLRDGPPARAAGTRAGSRPDAAAGAGRVRPLGQRPAGQQRQPQPARAPPACRLGRNASASTRASSSAWCARCWTTPKCAASDSSLWLGSGSAQLLGERDGAQPLPHRRRALRARVLPGDHRPVEDRVVRDEHPAGEPLGELLGDVREERGVGEHVARSDRGSTPGPGPAAG